MRSKVFGVCIVLALAGCDGPSAPVAGKGPREVASNGGGYTVVFRPSPDPIPMNQVFDIGFTVRSRGAAVASVEVDARMPAHGHGMNRVPKIVKQADGSFKAEGLLFHMPGHWELYFDLTQGGRTERAQVDVDLK